MHIDRDHPVARAGGIRAPHPVEQLLPTDRPARSKQESGQESLFTNRPEFQTRAAPPSLERPQQSESELLICIRGQLTRDRHAGSL
ncbi:hypothetical protein GCM10022233_43560 [Streptomyces shaanxiensis]|uniref:Uncharacterized protein n=1 Tax=Streptomyces shaanxiensis TaxID=653357 RepID=A0ABP7VDD5_9ACTN